MISPGGVNLLLNQRGTDRKRFISAGAVCDALNFGMKHFAEFVRLAMVGEKVTPGEGGVL